MIIATFRGGCAVIVKKLPNINNRYKLTQYQPAAAQEGTTVRQAEERESIEQVFSELNSLVGMEKIKKLVTEINAYIMIQQERRNRGLVAEPMVLHMIFKGNPGTGKTTVARILGRAFKKIGLLSKGHLIEVERADLVGEFIGHTAQKTRDVIKKAIGGILFIDEAYSLARGGEKDFGKEAIDTLVKAMEDNKDDLILILAGYKGEMEIFLKSNPGLRSRFPIQLEFPDYKIEELFEIGQSMLSSREYVLTAGARTKIREILYDQADSNELITGNARFIRNLIERAIRKQALRLSKSPVITTESLMTLERQDIIEAYEND
jgi:stage V sporulation protein K